MAEPSPVASGNNDSTEASCIVAHRLPLARPLQRTDVESAYGLALATILLPLAVGIAARHWLPTFAPAASELTFLALAILFVRLKKQTLIDGLRWRLVPPGLLVRGVILGVTGLGLATCIADALQQLLERVIGMDPFRESDIPHAFGHLGFLLLTGAILPGICEETLFRGSIQGVLERLGAWRGVVYTSLFFAASHLTPWHMVYPFVLGLIMGLATVRTGSVLPAMVMHICNNATCETMRFLCGSWDDQAADVGIERASQIPIIVLAVLFVPALLEFLRHTRGLRPRQSYLVGVPASLSRPMRWVIAGIAFVLAAMLLASLAAPGHARP